MEGVPHWSRRLHRTLRLLCLDSARRHHSSGHLGSSASLHPGWVLHFRLSVPRLSDEKVLCLTFSLF